MSRRLCNADRMWLKGIIPDSAYADEVIEWVEQGNYVFEDEENGV